MSSLKVILTASACFLYLMSIALAQNQPRYYYDGDGNNIGSSLPAGQNTFYYGGQGNNIGSAMRAGRNTFYYDAQGNSAGSSMPSGPSRDE